MAVTSIADLKSRAAAGNLFKPFQEDLVDTFESDILNFLQAQIDAVVGNYAQIVVLQDEKSSGTQGGDFVSGARRVRTLNSIYKHPVTLTWCVIAANQFTLALDGTYFLMATAPATGTVGGHRLTVRNVTDALDEPGLFDTGYVQAEPNDDAIIHGLLTVSGAPKTYQLEHESTGTQLTFGLGNAVNLGTEVYARAVLMRFLQ